ncbi:selenoprotein L [Scyliorhinus canicula]|uniref:selenoprotein L n=1 Tax=Scyliorhinus canicula TaxID=7830 RepID=UPI0018F496CC|nr:selenoprotein L [Scyliorhinus canicula]
MAGPGEAELLKALGELSGAGRVILEAARAASSGELLQEFVSQKIGQLAGMIPLYVKFLNSLHVQKRSDAEDLWKAFYHSTSVQDEVEDLMQFELEWNSFLSDVDARLKTDCFQAQLSMGKQVPGHMTFTDVRSEKEVRLEEFLHQEKLLLVLLRHFA